MNRAYLSLGSNLGDRERNLEDALRLLEDDRLHVHRLSGVYETEPLDLPGQPWFLNQAAEVETSLTPLELLERIHHVEAALGRRRGLPKGPRTVDIDILLYGNLGLETPDLTIPHPRMAERRFVLQPLAELAPELELPIQGKSVLELLAETKGQRVRQYSRSRTEGTGS